MIKQESGLEVRASTELPKVVSEKWYSPEYLKTLSGSIPYSGKRSIDKDRGHKLKLMDYGPLYSD